MGAPLGSGPRKATVGPSFEVSNMAPSCHPAAIAVTSSARRRLTTDRERVRWGRERSGTPLRRRRRQSGPQARAHPPLPAGEGERHQDHRRKIVSGYRNHLHSRPRSQCLGAGRTSPSPNGTTFLRSLRNEDMELVQGISGGVWKNQCGGKCFCNIKWHAGVADNDNHISFLYFTCSRSVKGNFTRIC